MESEELKYRTGQIMKKYRKTVGLSQEKFAELSGVSTTFVSYVEKGKQYISLDNFVKMSTALSIPATAILGEILETKPNKNIDDIFNRVNKLDYKERNTIYTIIETLLIQFETIK